MAGGVPERAPTIHAVVRDVHLGDVRERDALGRPRVDEVRTARRAQPLTQQPPGLLLAVGLRGLADFRAAVVVGDPPHAPALEEAAVAAGSPLFPLSLVGHGVLPARS